MPAHVMIFTIKIIFPAINGDQVKRDSIRNPPQDRFSPHRRDKAAVDRPRRTLQGYGFAQCPSVLCGRWNVRQIRIPAGVIQRFIEFLHFIDKTRLADNLAKFALVGLKVMKGKR